MSNPHPKPGLYTVELILPVELVVVAAGSWGEVMSNPHPKPGKSFTKVSYRVVVSSNPDQPAGQRVDWLADPRFIDRTRFTELTDLTARLGLRVREMSRSNRPDLSFTSLTWYRSRDELDRALYQERMIEEVLYQERMIEEVRSIREEEEIREEEDVAQPIPRRGSVPAAPPPVARTAPPAPVAVVDNRTWIQKRFAMVKPPEEK